MSIIEETDSLKQNQFDINNCLIEVPKISDIRGNLSFIEGNKHVPFEIKRVYYLYDVPSGEWRAGHAHKKLKQLILPGAGSFTIKLDDGKSKVSYLLNKPNEGVLVGSSVWREIHSFSSGAMCLVLASMEYDENDYYRKYEDFIESIN